MQTQAIIVRRHSPDWSGLAARFAETRQYDGGEFLPDPLPPGFPGNMVELIALWNESFTLDFFRCRARLAEIALSSCHAVDGARTLDVGRLPEVGRALSERTASVCLFVDDDDWFSPRLAAELRDADLTGHAVRWSAPIFRGALIPRRVHRRWPRCSVRGGRLVRKLLLSSMVRAARHLRGANGTDGLPVESIKFLFQTNNYGITPRLMRCHPRLDDVVDHVHASRLFDRRPFALRVVTLPGQVWSLTNKHPCSATRLALVSAQAEPQAAVRWGVERFVQQGRALRFPANYAWSRPLVARTLDLFEEALG